MGGSLTNNIYVIGAFAAISGIMFGFDIGSNSGVIGTPQYREYFHYPSDLVQGGINGSLSAGCFVGALFACYFADKFSRKYTLMGASALFVVGSVLQAASNGVPMLCAGRAINGLSVGVTSMVTPIYQSEVSPREIRGRIVAIQQWSITWGIMISFWIQYGCHFITGDHATAAFRIPWGLQGVPALILLIGMPLFPFSPRWLADQGRLDEARQVIADIHSEGDIHHPRVQTEFQEILAQVTFDREQASHRYTDLLQPKYAYRAFLGVSLQMWQQLTGMNIIMFYVVLLFEQAHIGGGDTGATLLSSGISYVVNVVMTVPAILFVDKWGRRPTLIIGALLMSLFLWIVGGIMTTGQWYIAPDTGKWTMEFVGNESRATGLVVCIYLFVATFATTWGPLGWIYPAEIYPLRIRALCVSLSTASNWLFNWIINFVVLFLMQHIRFGLYMLFGGFNLLMAIHVFLAFPETKGFTLEEMDIVFEQGVHSKVDRSEIERVAVERANSANIEIEKKATV